MTARRRQVSGNAGDHGQSWTHIVALRRVLSCRSCSICMNGSPSTPPSLPEQSHESGWTILKEPHRSSTRDSEDDSEPEEGHMPASRKRKANKSPLAFSRAAKSPKVSDSKSPGATRTSTQIRHSFGSVRELESRAGYMKTGSTSNGTLKPTVSASQSRVPGSLQLSDKRDSSLPKSHRPLHSVSSLRRGVSSSQPAPKTIPTDREGSSSSDSLPDPLALLRPLTEAAVDKQKTGESRKGKGKGFGDSTSVGKVSASSLPAPKIKDTFNNVNRKRFLTKTQPSVQRAADDDELIVISSDSDDGLRPIRGMPTQERRKEPRKAKEHAPKTFFSDSDGAIDLTSDKDISIVKPQPSEASKVRAKGKIHAGSVPSSASWGLKSAPSKSSDAAPQSNGISSRKAPSKTLSQARGTSPGDVSKPPATHPVVIPPSSGGILATGDARPRGSSRQMSRSAPVPSKSGSLQAVAPSTKSTNVGLAASVSNSSTTANDSKMTNARFHYNLPRPSLNPGPPQFTEKAARTIKRNERPAVDAEIIDLCSDSDEAMEVDGMLANNSELPDARTPPDAAPSVSDRESANFLRHRAISPPLSSPHVPLPQSDPPIQSSPTDHSRSQPVSEDSTNDISEPVENLLEEARRPTFAEAFTAVDAIFAEDPPTSAVDDEQRAGSLSSSTPPFHLPTNTIEIGKSSKGSPQYRSSLGYAIPRAGSGETSGLHQTGASYFDAPHRQNAEAGPSRLPVISHVPDTGLYNTNILDPAKDNPRSPDNLAESLVAPVTGMHLQIDVDDRDESSPDPLDVFTPNDDVMDVDHPLESIPQNTPRERASPVSSSSTSMQEESKSSGSSSMFGGSRSSGPSIQHARKTTRKPPGPIDSEGGSRSDISERDDTDVPESGEDLPNVTPSRPVISVKEPDFSKLRADNPNALEETVPMGSLSDAIQWPAEKIPTELHDMLNHLPANYHHNPQMKYIFESMMEENTSEDEPTSPRIELYSGQNGPVCPPWEFYYTNRIFHGKGVPRSDKKLLRGCDCDGPCDPTSKTCACVKRQMGWIGCDKGIKGFLYNKKGKVLNPGYPIFECNDACECSEECMNRVIQNGRQHQISICLTNGKGWGVYADEKIPRGTYLGIYAGEMLLESEAGERGKLYDKYGRTYLFDLDFYYLRSLEADKQKTQLSQGSTNDKEEEKSNLYTIDAFHVGNFTRFMNHSCDPNCVITPSYVNEPDLQKPTLTIFTTCDVKKGEELCFSYFGNDDEEDEEDQVDEHGQIKKVVGGPGTHTTTAIHRPCLCGTAKCRGKMF